jgi:DNA-binding MarR family transcriptional regulator
VEILRESTVNGQQQAVKLPNQDDLVISELLSYRLSRVANSLSRSAALRYRREFDVSLGEWRILALLGASAPLTLNRLARRSGLDKAQMSRTVKGLVERGLLTRTFGAGRTTALTLSKEGEELYLRLIGAANERERRIRRHLGVRDGNALDRVLESLIELSNVLEQEELHLSGNGD